jgi:hypothetical protein
MTIMAKQYELTQQEVFSAELYALKLGLTIILHNLLREHPNRDAAYDELANGVAQMADMLPYGDIPQERRDIFRSAVREKASMLLRLSRTMERHQLQ